CGKRTGLKAVVIMDEKAVLNENAGAYKGLDRFDGRKKVVADLEAQGFLEKVEDHSTPVGTCYRCGTIVEPYLSEQWFVSMKPLAAPAVQAVKGGDVRFVPERWTKVYLDWMENIRDWCISRQIWWGHRIPVWYCPASHAVAAAEDPKTCAACGSTELRQDEDVLDTWFSSALWPFATLGWPDETPDLEKFYPGEVLVTSRDIINLWVARMIVSGLEFRGENPFSDVIIHATIMDDEGKRMSKSKGTGVDPLELIDVYGADPLRFALAWSTRGTQDLRFGRRLSKQRVEMARNFVTKLWNAARFAAQKAPGLKPGPSTAAVEDRWILSRLSGTVEAVGEALDAYEFGEAAEILYKFVWDDFCDWYIELSKRREDAGGTLATVLDAVLRLLHPFIPFVTEEIWQKAGRPQPLMTAAWPEAGKARDPELEARMAHVFEAVRGVRDVRTRNNIPPKTPLRAAISAPDEATAQLMRQGEDIVRSQANLSGLEIGVNLPKPKLAAAVPGTDFTLYVPLEGLIDVKAEAERTRKELEKAGEQLGAAERQIANEEFRKRKPEMAAEIAEKIEGFKARIVELEAHLRELQA
ncbi:MAG TPA: class I tRNA ligase family protein, partial [Planctomycetota bacterium]|nr:class I tRNA ligase family protein [Planctomycetota bacterium]